MDEATWQILPPRKKGRRSGKLSADSTIKEESLEGIEARTTQIEKNIAARAENSSSGKNAEATLEGKLSPKHVYENRNEIIIVFYVLHFTEFFK